MNVLLTLGLVLALIAVGDAVTLSLGLPVPGAALALLLVALWVFARGGPPAPMARLFDGLIPFAPVLFVPAGAGLVANLDLIASGFAAIAAVIVLGTALVLVATGLAAQALLGGRRAVQ